MMPRPASLSSILHGLSGKRKHSQTAWLMTSAGTPQPAWLETADGVISPSTPAQPHLESHSAATLTVPRDIQTLTQ